MAIPEGVNRRYAFIAAVILGVLWIWVALDRPYSFPKHVPWNTYANAPQAPKPTSIADDTPKIKNDVFEYPTVDSEPIRNMCSGTQWNESLVFICDNADGNVAQVRNAMLMCTRYAISAGANMVLPRFINGDGKHEVGITVLDWDRQDIDFYFDKQHFLDSMKKSCPEMEIIQIRDTMSPSQITTFDHLSITVRADKLLPRQGENWRSVLYNLIRDMVSPTEDTKPIIIEMARPSPVYDILSDGRQFASDFGQLFKVRPDVRALANKTLQKLAETYNLTFDLTPIPNNTFYGVHLYTNEDRLGPTEGWPKVDWENARYDPETKHYFDQAAQKGHTMIYIASTKQTDIEKFKKDAQKLNMQAHSKYDLLAGRDRDEL